MLTRLYVDNFRCFVNFEHKPAKRQLILGANGSGKSSYLDALLLLRQFVTTGNIYDEYILSRRTRWLSQPNMTWELEATLDGGRYVYRLLIEPWGEPAQWRPRVAAETLHLDGKPIFEFKSGEVHLYDDRFQHKVSYEFDPRQSALSTIVPSLDNQKVNRFQQWIAGLYCFRINPFGMGPQAHGENPHPNVDLSNVAAWYRHLVQVDPEQSAAMRTRLRESLEGFSFLRLEPAGENVSLLAADFTTSGGKTNKVYFNELSDGQRCLICLYMILHFVLAKGRSVIIDEPDNFISLREIQPWLMAVADTVEDSNGQILLISHHPEAINQWAPSNGVQFFREGAGPVRVATFRGDPDAGLPPSELIARGWERE